MRVEEAGAYLRVIARVAPPALLLNEHDEMGDLSDEELAAYLRAVREAIVERDELN